MSYRSLHIAALLLVVGATFSGGVQSAPPPPSTICGDTAGPNGKDLRCYCGNRVVTDTVLDKRDPVRRSCAADGLVIADGIRLDLNGIAISGSGAGVGIAAGAGSTLMGGTVQGFRTGVSVLSGHAILTDVSIQNNADAGLVVGASQGAAAQATVSGTGAGVSDNGGPGIVVHPSAVLTITGSTAASRLPVLRNAGIGIDVRGELHANLVEVGFSGGEGVRVDTIAAVEILGCDVHHSGNHPDGVLPDKAGILALQTHPESGLRIAQLTAGDGGSVHDNSGNGIALGDASQQNGAVYGFVGEQQIYNNEEGIHVAQRDPVAQPTASTILFNNIFNNRGAGVHLATSEQRYSATADQRAFSSNDVHHNAITGAGCLPTEASQADSQIVVDGPITGTDSTVSNQVANACPADASGIAPCVPCGSDPDANCMGPNSSFEREFICYWGVSNDGTAASRNDTELACNQMNNPSGADSGGISNHCLWNGSQCRYAWDLGGSESPGGTCDSSRNRIYAYVNDPTKDPSTQKGLAARFGAVVRARRNSWGLGGPANGTFESAATDSRIDSDEACDSISTCP